MASIKTFCDRLPLAGAHAYDSQSFGNGESIAGPATLLRVLVANKGSALWLAFFNATSVAGTPWIAPIAVPASTGLVVVDLSTVQGEGYTGIAFPVGLTWAASSAAVFAQDASSSLWLTAIYAN